MKISPFVVTLGLLSASACFASDYADLKSLIGVLYAKKPASGQTVTLQASDLKQLIAGYDIDSYISGIDHIDLTTINEKKSASGDALQAKITTTTGHTYVDDLEGGYDDGGGDGNDTSEDAVLRVENNSTIEIFQPTTEAAIDRVNEQAKLVAGGLAQKIYGLFDKDNETADEAKADIDDAADERAPMIARINQLASGTASDKPILLIKFEGISAGIKAVPMGLDVSSAIMVPGVVDSDGYVSDPMILSVSRGTLGTHTNPILKFLHKIPTTMFRQEMVF